MSDRIPCPSCGASVWWVKFPRHQGWYADAHDDDPYRRHHCDPAAVQARWSPEDYPAAVQARWSPEDYVPAAPARQLATGRDVGTIARPAKPQPRRQGPAPFLTVGGQG